MNNDIEDILRQKAGARAYAPNIRNTLMGPSGAGKTTLKERYDRGLGADLSDIVTTNPTKIFEFNLTTMKLIEPLLGGNVLMYELKGEESKTENETKISIFDLAGQETLKGVVNKSIDKALNEMGIKNREVIKQIYENGSKDIEKTLKEMGIKYNEGTEKLIKEGKEGLDKLVGTKSAYSTGNVQNLANADKGVLSCVYPCNKNNSNELIDDWVEPLLKLSFRKGSFKVVQVLMTKADTKDSYAKMNEVKTGEYDSLYGIGIENTCNKIHELLGVYPLVSIGDNIKEVTDEKGETHKNAAEWYFIGMTKDGKFLDTPLQLNYKGALSLGALIYMKEYKFADKKYEFDKYSERTMETLRKLNVI